MLNHCNHHRAIKLVTAPRYPWCKREKYSVPPVHPWNDQSTNSTAPVRSLSCAELPSTCQVFLKREKKHFCLYWFRSNFLRLTLNFVSVISQRSRTNLEFNAEKLTADGGNLDFKIDFWRADMLTYRRRRVRNTPRTRAFGSHVCKGRSASRYTVTRTRERDSEEKRREERCMTLTGPPARKERRGRETHTIASWHTHANRTQMAETIFFYFSPFSLLFFLNVTLDATIMLISLRATASLKPT